MVSQLVARHDRSSLIGKLHKISIVVSHCTVPEYCINRSRHAGLRGILTEYHLVGFVDLRKVGLVASEQAIAYRNRSALLQEWHSHFFAECRR